MATKKGSQKAKLDALGVDAVCEMILDDMSYRAIAAEYAMSIQALLNWIDADPERSARVNAARVKSAQQCDFKALEALEQIDDDAQPGMIARQREIASHYRWRAKTRNPREFGDALKLDADVKVNRDLPQVDAQIARLMAKLGSNSPKRV